MSLCYNIISYVKYQMRYPIPGQSLTAGGVDAVPLHITVTLMLTCPLPCCTRATCLIVSRPAGQYNYCYSFVDMLQKLERE
jgi:hypothetical protein